MYKHESNLELVRKHISILLSAVVNELYPSCIPCSGSNTEEGFYCDFYFGEHDRLSSDELPDIASKLKGILNRPLEFEYPVLSKEDALKCLSDNSFMQQLIQQSLEQGPIKMIKHKQSLDLYPFESSVDVELLKHASWRLDSISGAYWMGSESNPMLIRINAFAFIDQLELEEYIAKRKEAADRDHRKLGQELELFASSQLVGKGLPMLLPKGAMLRMILERFIVDEELRRGYLSVYTPPIASLRLYETSGHWHFYKDSMYPPIEMGNDKYMLRPTSCPHHIMLYSDRPRSYRELPMRIGEIASLFRKEQSGELSGLVRVMNFTLADAHIFCTPEQVRDEFIGAVQLVKHVMKCLGIEGQISFRASLRDDSEKFFNNPEMWERSEALLLSILDDMKLEYSIGYGEAAFYGPKLDIQMRNVFGKEETVFTVQIDSYLPERFKLNYINQEGEKQPPVIIHRSSVGCIERTMAFLIEYYRGAFPSWLAPVQSRILTINDKHVPYAEQVEQMLKENNIRVERDFGDDKLGKKIRNGRLMKIPYLIIIGDAEMESSKITIRNRDSGNQCTLDISEFIAALKREVGVFSIGLEADKSYSPYDSWNMLHL